MNGCEKINPILVARRFDQQYRTPGFNTYSAVADRFGVTRPVVCYYLALLHRLPPDFIDWLESCSDKRALAFFTESRLRPIARIADTDARQRHLQNLCAQYQER